MILYMYSAFTHIVARYVKLLPLIYSKIIRVQILESSIKINFNFCHILVNESISMFQKEVVRKKHYFKSFVQDVQKLNRKDESMEKPEHKH